MHGLKSEITMPNQREHPRTKHPWTLSRTNENHQEIPNTVFLEKLKQRFDKSSRREHNVSYTDLKLQFPPINKKSGIALKCICQNSAPVHSLEKGHSYESFSSKKTSIGHVPGYGTVKIKSSRLVRVSSNTLGSIRVSGSNNHSGYLAGRQIFIPKEARRGVDTFTSVPGTTFPETIPPKETPSCYGTVLPPIGSTQTTVPSSSQNYRKKDARMKTQTISRDRLPKKKTKYDLDIINSRAKKPPFNTYTDEEASRRFINHYYG
ncbi:uncharacterized protein LOC134264182 [Saccostrea cucullata]|uniref:uncharacterized protein LOC134264182 n=1 Tax=Saccostrea cuccullata TaxID=36930 RepID=UPI002ED49360